MGKHFQVLSQHVNNNSLKITETLIEIDGLPFRLNPTRSSGILGLFSVPLWHCKMFEFSLLKHRLKMCNCWSIIIIALPFGWSKIESSKSMIITGWLKPNFICQQMWWSVSNYMILLFCIVFPLGNPQIYYNFILSILILPQRHHDKQIYYNHMWRLTDSTTILYVYGTYAYKIHLHI